jgi:Ser-tRNA(Ala) deacylase AlaX
MMTHTSLGDLVLDQSIFHPTGGGQAGDKGRCGSVEMTPTVWCGCTGRLNVFLLD